MLKFVKNFNNYFVKITDELDIYNWGEDVYYYSKLTNRMSVINIHPSIRLIKHKYQQPLDFKFKFVFTNQVLKYINELTVIKVQEETYLQILLQ